MLDKPIVWIISCLLIVFGLHYSGLVEIADLSIVVGLVLGEVIADPVSLIHLLVSHQFHLQIITSFIHFSVKLVCPELDIFYRWGII